MNYINKKNFRIATVISEDTKCKTVMLQFADDGSVVPITTATLKRWWKPVEENTEVKESEETLVPMPGIEKLAELKKEVSKDKDDDTCADGRKYAEIGKEIAEQAKQKAEEAKTANKKNTAKANKPATDSPIAIATAFCSKLGKKYRVTTAKNNVGIYVDDVRVVDIWGRKTKIRVYVSGDNKAFKSLSTKLYEKDSTANKGKLNVSVYIEQSNIETALTQLLKEEK